MKKVFAILLLVFSLLLVSCTKEEEKPNVVPDVESIEFKMDSYTLTPGTHTLIAVALPEGSNQQINFSIQGVVDGVSIDRDKLSIGNAVNDGTEFTVVATSVYDPTIRETKVFKVSNVVEDAVEIRTEAELRAINNGLSGSYKLMNDIELESPWVPIGIAEVEEEDGSITPGTPFTGIFDGQGFTISGIVIESETPLFNAGFFAQIGSTAVVRNAGFIGSVVATGWSGGIAGINDGLIENVFSNITVSVAGTSAGSIVSVNRGLIQYAYGIGKVVSETNPNTAGRSAGLVVANDGSMIEVYGDYETLETPNYAAFTPSTNPTYMLPTVDMKMATTWGSFNTDVWYIADGIYPLLKHEGFIPPVIVPELGLTIKNTETELDLEEVDSIQITAEIINPEGGEILIYELKESVNGVTINETGLVSFDTELVPANFTFTVIVTIAGTEVRAEKAFSGVYNPEIVDDIIYIENETELLNLLAGQTNPENLSKTFILKNDIELTENWTAIGIAPNEDEGIVGIPFTGVFDGQGYKISGINMPNGGWNKAFFGFIGEGAVVKNTHFEGYLEANAWSGALAANNSGTIQDVVIDIEVYAYSGNAGAIVEHNHGLLKNIIVLGKAVSDSGGTNTGLVATNFGTLENVFANIETVGTLNLVALGQVADDGTHIISATNFISAETYVDFDEDIWYVADGTHPLLKHEGFEPPVIVPELGLSITNDELEIDVEDSETVQINTSIINGLGNEVLVYSLKENVNGVTINQSGLVSFDTELVSANFTFTVVVTIEDTEVKAEKTFTVTYNPVIVDDNVYIETEADLLNLLAGQTNPENLSKTFILKNDIVLIENWTAIGLAPNEDEGITGVPFTGVFDGQGFKISGINMPGGGFNKAFFGFIGEGAIVKNTHFEGYIEANAWSGALAANNSGTIQDVVVDIEVYAYGGNAGAIVEHNHGLLKNIIVLGKAVSDDGGSNTGLVTTNFGNLENVFANVETVGTLNLVALGQVADDGTHIISATNFTSAETYVNFDENIWNIPAEGIPTLKTQE